MVCLPRFINQCPSNIMKQNIWQTARIINIKFTYYNSTKSPEEVPIPLKHSIKHWKQILVLFQDNQIWFTKQTEHKLKHMNQQNINSLTILYSIRNQSQQWRNSDSSHAFHQAHPSSRRYPHYQKINFWWTNQAKHILNYKNHQNRS